MHPMNQTEENRVSVGIWLALVKATVKNLSNVTLAEIIREVEQLPGSTRFLSISVIIAFFYTGLSEKEGYLLLGYNDFTGMKDRLSRAHLEVENLYKAYKKLKKAGLLVKSLKWALDPSRRNKRGIPYSKNRVDFSRRIVQEMVIYHLGSRKRASSMTGVPMSTIKFWLEY